MIVIVTGANKFSAVRTLMALADRPVLTVTNWDVDYVTAEEARDYLNTSYPVIITLDALPVNPTVHARKVINAAHIIKLLETP